MSRLAEALATPTGEVVYELEFGKDGFGIDFIALRATTELNLICQRSLESFFLPVVLDVRLGLIAREDDEAGLPPGYEALLTSDGQIRPADVIEDELLLAVPLIPVKPGQEESEVVWSTGPLSEPEPVRENPFATLDRLKNK
ncbi:MAG: YceD family protein [Tahibacter sp.]